MSNDIRNPAQGLELERRLLSQRLDEVARLVESSLPPPQFYGELLQRTLDSLAAKAGCVWLRTPQGNLQQAFQINFAQSGLEADEEARAGHDALLRLVFTSGQPVHLPPRSVLGQADPGQAAPSNPTAFILLLVPIRLNEQVVGLIEVLQGANRPANAVAGFLHYMGMMADNAGRYQRNQLMSQLSGQQQLWTQLEAFARTIHGSLNPTEVAFHVANEGRRLIECDRLAVALRPRGQKTRIEAVSGSDVVEKRSNQVQKMRDLAERVLEWGERLVFSGVQDDSLPPKVLKALDAYIAESPSRLLVVLPLHDQREGDDKDKEKAKPLQPPRSALVMESYEAPADPAATVARLEVVSKHAASALYNSLELKRIPFRWLWMPLATLQEGLGGPGRTILLLVVAALSLVGAALCVLPYPLRVDANGTVVPVARRTVYPSIEGKLLGFTVQPGDLVPEGSELARMQGGVLEEKLLKLQADMQAADNDSLILNEQAARSGGSTPEARDSAAKARNKARERDSRKREMDSLIARNGADRNDFRFFSLLAPPMTHRERAMAGSEPWQVLTSNFQDMVGREVKPNEPIMRLGITDGPWEMELKLPQKHVGQVLKGFARLKPGEPLSVDFLLLNDTTRLYKGMLFRNRIAGEATAGQDAASESEPVVIAYVDIENPGIPEGYRVSRKQLVSGTEVRAKVDCGKHVAGYSLFYGVWEFVYEKVVFFF